MANKKWSMKYKKSINCNKPKGFSQKQHCKYGKKKRKSLRKKGGLWLLDTSPRQAAANQKRLDQKNAANKKKFDNRVSKSNEELTHIEQQLEDAGFHDLDTMKRQFYEEEWKKRLLAHNSLPNGIDTPELTKKLINKTELLESKYNRATGKDPKRQYDVKKVECVLSGVKDNNIIVGLKRLHAYALKEKNNDETLLYRKYEWDELYKILYEILFREGRKLSVFYLSASSFDKSMAEMRRCNEIPKNAQGSVRDFINNFKTNHPEWYPAEIQPSHNDAPRNEEDNQTDS